MRKKLAWTILVSFGLFVIFLMVQDINILKAVLFVVVAAASVLAIVWSLYEINRAE